MIPIEAVTKLPELRVLYETAERELVEKYVYEFGFVFDDNGVPAVSGWENQKDFMWNCFKEDLAEIFAPDEETAEEFRADEIRRLRSYFPAGTTLPQVIDIAFPRQDFIEWLAENQHDPFEGLE